MRTMRVALLVLVAHCAPARVTVTPDPPAGEGWCCVAETGNECFRCASPSSARAWCYALEDARGTATSCWSSIAACDAQLEEHAASGSVSDCVPFN